MRKLLKILVYLTILLLLVAALAWWWYLRADAVEPPALPGQVQTGSLEHDGKSRHWLAYIPADIEPSPAIVLVMHGSMGTGEQMRVAAHYGFDVQAERHGFIVVYPDGYEKHWNDCRGSADYAANLEDIDDVGFLRSVVQRMVDEFGADSGRVFATGLSNGGQMAYRLGLEAPDLVTGIAAIAASLPVDSSLGCEKSGQAVATLVMNGTLDPVNPYEGGLVEIFGNASRGTVLSSLATAQYWAGLAGHEGAGQQHAWPRQNPGDDTSVKSVEWSAAGKPPVSLVTIVGGGHTVPNAVFNMPRILGPTSHQLDGPEVIWAFFDSVAPGPR